MLGLRELGYVEGKNIVIEWRFAEGKYERLPGLATELVQLKVDLIVALTDNGVDAAQHATATITATPALASGQPATWHCRGEPRNYMPKSCKGDQ